VRGVTPIGRVLKDVIDDLGIAAKLSEHRAVIDWPEIVGAKIASHSRALRVEQGRLLVEVGSSVWAQELSLMRTTIIGKVNARLGRSAVESVHFVVGGKTPHGPSGRNGHEDGNDDE
jgi:predicted nucleic acid-binding Zn ribbon protein